MAKVLNIKQFVFDYSIPQSELSDVLGLKQPQVSLLLNGKRKILDKHEEAMRAKYGALIEPYFVEKKVSRGAGGVTIFPAAVIDDIKDELSQPKTEDTEVIETLEAIPVISTEQAKAPNIDVKALVQSGSKEVKRLSIWEFFEKFGEFDAICPTYRDSMIPTYVPGDFLFIKYKQVTNDSYIKQGRYLIDTREHGTILCIVEDTEDGWLTLSFKNARKYKPMRVKKEDVMSIADIVLMVRMGDMAFETIDIGALQVQLDKKDMQIDNLFAQLGSLTNQMDKQGDRTNRVIDQIEDSLEQNKRLVNLMTENYLKKK